MHLCSEFLYILIQIVALWKFLHIPDIVTKKYTMHSKNKENIFMEASDYGSFQQQRYRECPKHPIEA